ncbi:ADP-ribosylation factor-like protein 11 [Latimeria chalumnae]|nr:PREDICTED: ADP-ribosylation factor-like protein 11 [Latimeria chalumnae]|eukprot:XP_006000618.1 PREDICTED: ADP-ribosylation factor-like protein 11 [Latimeria chalumnae]
MGNPNSKYTHKKQARVLMMGLDNAGKSTLLYKLKHNKIVQTSPTVGFNVETLLTERHVSLSIWDVGGQDKLRPSWKYYTDDTDALIFVVDSTEEVKLLEAEKELKNILDNVNIRGIPFLILANKQDVPNALSIKEILSKLKLDSAEYDNFEIRGCSAYTGEGLTEAVNTLAENIRNHWKQLV